MAHVLSSFAADMNAVVVGGSGGIGRALVARLLKSDQIGSLTVCSRSTCPIDDPRLRNAHLDLSDEASIDDAAYFAGAGRRNIDLVIVATGLLHDGERLRPEKTFRAIDARTMARSFAVNTIGPALIAKHFLPLLSGDRKSVFAALSARVGSISDNELGGWHAYRSSKSALNMLIRNFAIEMGRRNKQAICVGLHPGTVATKLSAPFSCNVPEKKLFSPDFSASRLLDVIDRLRPEDSGGVFAWDKSAIPA